MEKRRNFEGLDIIKIIAATFIVFHHYQQVFEVRFSGINFYDGAFDFGYLVELFFIISGFLTLYTNKAGESTAQKLLHKLLRIYPMAIIACAFTLAIKSVRAEELSLLWNGKTLFANFLLLFSGWPGLQMIGINNPTWYLCVLIQCYLVFHLLIYVSEKWKIKRVYLFVAAIVLSFGLHRLHFLPDSVFRGIEAFFIGACLCEVKDRIPKKQWAAILLAMASVVLIVLFPSQQRRIVVLLTFPLFVILGMGLNVGAAASKAITTLGKASFEVFIWHYPLMAAEQMIARITGFEISRSYVTMLVFTVIAWCIGFLLYKFVETPINKLIRKIES